MGQLKGIGGNLPRMGQMRAAAEVLPRPVPIHPQIFAFGNAVDKLDLEGLAAVLIVGNRAGAVPDFGFHRIAGVDDLLHAGFDRAKVFRREGFRPVKVVKPAVIAHWADGDLHIGPNVLDRARHDMGTVVADQFQRLGVIGHGVNGDLCIRHDRPLQIIMRAVHRCRNGLFRQTGGDGHRHFGGGHACGVVALVTIGEGEGDLGHGLILVCLAPTKRPVAGYVRVVCRVGWAASRSGWRKMACVGVVW